MMKDYYYIIKWNEEEGWQISPTEEDEFPNGTIFNHKTKEWEQAYLGDGKFNGQEDELATQLSRKLYEMNGEYTV